MRFLRLGALATLSLLLPACSTSSSDGGSSGQMFLESCSLGCGSGSTGTPVNCAIVNVAQNVELTLVFSEPVNENTLNSGTFLLINAVTGTVPAVRFSVDPADSRRVIARPQVTFDGLNNPQYALQFGATYDLIVPGSSTGGSGPFIRSANGKDNQTALRCTIVTSEELNDPVPGPPIQTAFVDVLDGMGGVIQDVPADGATEVALDSDITVVFEDIMNPATLSNPTTNTATFITTKIDPDGNVADPTDQVEITGDYATVVDFDNLRTTTVFTPAAGLPSAGTDIMNPRKIVMNLPSGIEDLVANPLANPGSVVFATTAQILPPIVLPEDGGEKFTDSDNQDDDESGAEWGSGRLTYGLGGGAGRLGELVVRSGQTIVLNTDSQEFPLPEQVGSLLTNEEPFHVTDNPGGYSPTEQATWPTITVTSGDFDFTRLVVESNSTLVLTGSQPGRVFSRGDLVVAGVIDCSGETPAPHLSNTWRPFDPDSGDLVTDPPSDQDLEAAYGGTGGVGGPNAGGGGNGSDRYFYEVDQPNATAYTRLAKAGAISYNEIPVPTNNGQYGTGVATLGTLAAGPGGKAYPSTPPGDTLLTNINWGSDLSFTNTITTTADCRSAMVAGPGGGGAYALNGGEGIPRSDVHTVTEAPMVLPTVPANTAGGDNTALNLEDPGEVIIRSLNHGLGLLRGGSGGGGGGTHFWGSRILSSFSNPDQCNATGLMLPMWDHSAAGGGGGGGAFQAASGGEILVSGVIDTSGGAGGSSTAFNTPIGDCKTASNPTFPDYQGHQENIELCGSNATPGGGGSGGSLKVQGRSVTLAGLPGRLTVEGGTGGTGVGGSTGGDGSPGLVRIEFEGFTGNQATHADDYADRVAPYLPSDTDFNTPFTSAAILSLGEFGVQRIRPDSFTSSMSCWMKPDGNFFGLDFAADDDSDPDDPDGKNWNMDVIYNDNGTERLFPYRGLTADPNFPLGSVDFETFLGDNQINHDLAAGDGSLISVRFQGARLSGELTDPCDVRLEAPGSDIDSGSLTTWVTDPEDLNQFLPKPNMVRFVVVFEQVLKTQGPVQARIQGITNLRVNVQPN